VGKAAAARQGRLDLQKAEFGNDLRHGISVRFMPVLDLPVAMSSPTPLATASSSRNIGKTVNYGRHGYERPDGGAWQS